MAYGYDAAGHRTTVGGRWARTGLPQAVAGATYDAANRITAWAGQPLSYDADGNLASDGPTSYAWNARNQLASLSGAASGSFAYDAQGRRRVRTTGGATSYLYDGANAAQELVGGSPTANVLTGGVDEVFQRTEGAGTSAVLTDALGSTVALVDWAGAVQTQYTYEPFGATATSGAASTNPAQYTGRENDGTGLYYYRARYYNSQLGRFISEDPAGLVFGPDLYRYASDSPTNYFDPSGEAPIDYVLPNWLANHINWNYVPAICNADSFRFYGGGGGSENVQGGAYHLDDAHYSNGGDNGWRVDGMESGTLLEALGENWGAGAVMSGRKPKEALLFPTSPYHTQYSRQVGPIQVRGEFGLGPLIGYGSDGIAIGFYGDVGAGAGIGNHGGGFAGGGGWSVTLSSATSCVAQ